MRLLPSVWADDNALVRTDDKNKYIKEPKDYEGPIKTRFVELINLDKHLSLVNMKQLKYFNPDFLNSLIK